MLIWSLLMLTIMRRSCWYPNLGTWDGIERPDLPELGAGDIPERKNTMNTVFFKMLQYFSILVIMTVNFCLCNMDYHRYNILFRILANSVSFSIATSLSLPLPYSTTFDLSFLKLSALISSVFPQQSRTLYMNWSTSIKVNQLGLGFSQENYNLSTIRLKLIMHPLSSQILFMIG